jgi:hypothetical protein
VRARHNTNRSDYERKSLEQLRLTFWTLHQYFRTYSWPPSSRYRRHGGSFVLLGAEVDPTLTVENGHANLPPRHWLQSRDLGQAILLN